MHNYFLFNKLSKQAVTSVFYIGMYCKHIIRTIPGGYVNIHSHSELAITDEFQTFVILY